MKKIFTLFLTAILLLNAMSIAAFAADSTTAEPKEKKVRSVQISSPVATVRVNQIRTLFAYVLPTDADHQEIFWSSSNNEIVVVDGDGDVTGISPGTAIVTATSHDGKQYAECEITVPETTTTARLYNVSEEKPPLAEISGGEILYAATLRSDVDSAAARLSDKNAAVKVTYQNKSRVSPAALRSADYAARMNNMVADLRFDTTTGAGKIQGRLRINPALYSGPEENLRLRVWTKSEYIDGLAAGVKAKLNRPFVIVHCEQSGSYGMTVSIAAKADLAGLDKSRLKIYSYSPGANKYTLLEGTGLWYDENGYFQFKTNSGGVYVITDYSI